MTTERQDIIKITGLKKSFGDLEVLKGIDLSIKEKEVVVIISLISHLSITKWLI